MTPPALDLDAISDGLMTAPAVRLVAPEAGIAIDRLVAALRTERARADAAEKRCRKLAMELDRAAGFVENAADIIEADQGDIDEECAAARSEAAAWRTLAMVEP